MTTNKTTEQRIAELEGQIAKLQAKQTELYTQLTNAQLEQWRGRIDDLEVQLHLGAMEASEHLTPLMDQLRSRWTATRAQMKDASSTTTEVVDTLRSGLENAYDELREAVLQSRRKVSH